MARTRFASLVEDAENDVTGQFTLTVLLAGRVDLGVTLSATPSPAPLDAPTTWNIVVANRSPGTDAAGVSLTALFRGNAPYRFDAPTTPGCTVTPSGNQTTLSCTLGPLAGGATNTVALTGRSSVAGDVYGTATVSLSAGGVDEVPSNDRGSASLSVAQRVSSSPAQRIANVSARAAAAADLDGDGFDDLAVAADSAQGLLVFANVADPAGIRSWPRAHKLSAAKRSVTTLRPPISTATATWTSSSLPAPARRTAPI